LPFSDIIWNSVNQTDTICLGWTLTISQIFRPNYHYSPSRLTRQYDFRNHLRPLKDEVQEDILQLPQQSYSRRLDKLALLRQDRYPHLGLHGLRLFSAMQWQPVRRTYLQQAGPKTKSRPKQPLCCLPELQTGSQQHGHEPHDRQCGRDQGKRG
jgi:hypothetical protein